VGERLGGAADALLGPRCLGQRAVGVESNRLAGGADLAGFLPVAADRRVRQPGVMSRHRVRIVIEDAADDFLRDVHVDQAGSQRVTILMRGQAGRLAVLVADIAAPQPLAERVLVAGMTDPLAAVGVGPAPGKQDRGPLGPAVADAALLIGDLGFELFVDGTSASRFILWFW